MIDGKSLFDVPIKNEEETHEKIIEMGRKNDYTAENLLDYEYFSNNYELIAIDFSIQYNKLILLVELITSIHLDVTRNPIN